MTENTGTAENHYQLLDAPSLTPAVVFLFDSEEKLDGDIFSLSALLTFRYEQNPL